MCVANSAPRDVGVVKWGRGAVVKGGGHTRESKIAIYYSVLIIW